MYPAATGKLKHLWHKFTSKILLLAVAKARNDKERQQVYKKKPPNDDDENNFSGCLALNALFYLCPSFDTTVKQDLSMMFRKAPRGSMINEEIQKISDQTAAEGKDNKYFEYQIGMPFKFFICIDQLIYETSNFIMAVDILLKAYFVFNMDFPPEAANILTLVQHFFYQIFLANDIEHTSIFQLMCDIAIERALQCEELMNEEST